MSRDAVENSHEEMPNTQRRFCERCSGAIRLCFGDHKICLAKCRNWPVTIIVAVVVLCLLSIFRAYGQLSKPPRDICEASARTSNPPIDSGKAYVAIESTSQIRLVHGRAEVKTLGRSLIGRDVAGRTVSVMFPGKQITGRTSETALSILINDPRLHRRFLVDPHTKIAKIILGDSASYPAAISNCSAGNSESSAGTELSNAGLLSISAQKMPFQKINGVLAVGTKRILAPVGSGAALVRIVSETWYSQELWINVLSISFDPRIGDLVTEVTNIEYESPAPTYFVIPPGYRSSRA